MSKELCHHQSTVKMGHGFLSWDSSMKATAGHKYACTNPDDGFPEATLYLEMALFPCC